MRPVSNDRKSSLHARGSWRFGIALPVAAIAVLLLTGLVQGHVLKSFGPYTIALGWVHEPTYVGQLNAVQAVVTDDQGKPVTDLADGDLTVVVTVGGQSSDGLDLVPTYDEDTGLGTPGDYEASLIPTVPGDYTFHLTGSVHGTAVDETATSSDSTFDAAVDDQSIEFPAKLPTLTEVTTRLDRLDSRVAAIASPAPAAAASSAPDPAIASLGTVASAAQSAATEAHDSATRALVVAVVLGGLGVILGGAALVVATRRRPVAGS